MTKLIVLITAALLCVSPMASAQQISKKKLAELENIADRIALIEAGPVPDILIFATIAATQADHLTRDSATSELTGQLAGQYLAPSSTLQRKAERKALSAQIAERMAPLDIARTFAATVYYGRNCYGFDAAIRGLARKRVSQAKDNDWLALAALPRSPSFYLRDRSALRERVRGLITDMRIAGLVTAKQANRLEDLPLSNLDNGQGCAS